MVRSIFHAHRSADVEGHPVRATLSIGLAMFETGRAGLDPLLAQADHALYCAKERGRNRAESAVFDWKSDDARTPLVRGLTTRTAA